LVQDPAGPYALGLTGVTLTATDPEGASDSCTGNVTVADDTPPVISASLTKTLFIPMRAHDLVNVGLQATATDACGPPTAVQVDVYGDEDDETPTDALGTVFSPDAKDIAVSTLRLRAERMDAADGRVYLIILHSSDGSGNTGFSCKTVVVPRSSSAANIASVNSQAATALAYCQGNNGTPAPGYFIIGDGPVIGPKQ
jgi:hypothetical protein